MICSQVQALISLLVIHWFKKGSMKWKNQEEFRPPAQNDLNDESAVLTKPDHCRVHGAQNPCKRNWKRYSRQYVQAQVPWTCSTHFVELLTRSQMFPERKNMILFKVAFHLIACRYIYAFQERVGGSQRTWLNSTWIKHHLNREHFCLNRVRQIFHQPRCLFNDEDNHSHHLTLKITHCAFHCL